MSPFLSLSLESPPICPSFSDTRALYSPNCARMNYSCDTCRARKVSSDFPSPSPRKTFGVSLVRRLSGTHLSSPSFKLVLTSLSTLPLGQM